MSIWKRIFSDEPDPPPSIEAQMEAALTAVDKPGFSQLGRLLTAIRKHRTSHPELVLRMADAALPLAKTPIERGACKYEIALTNLQEHGLAGSSIFATSSVKLPDSMTPPQRATLRSCLDTGTEAFKEYPSFGYPGEHAYEMCLRIVGATYNQGDLHTWREWQLVVAAFHTTDKGEMVQLPESPTEQEKRTAHQIKDLLVERRKLVSKEAYEEGVRRGVVPPDDPVRM
jgi:hypothetical protein